MQQKRKINSVITNQQAAASWWRANTCEQWSMECHNEASIVSRYLHTVQDSLMLGGVQESLPVPPVFLGQMENPSFLNLNPTKLSLQFPE